VRQLTVVSGKGGTGKTTLVAAFASLAENAVMADCDVDAPDLHLILNPTIKEEMEFTGLKLAHKNPEKCTECGLCQEHCRFEAIDQDFNIIDQRCEGCGVCVFVCPEEAIELRDRVSGVAYISDTRFGPMSHAKLGAGEEASGKLVALVRNNARIMAEREGRDLIIIDGPPGIGCPLISSLAGTDLALVIAEPTVSGVHDLGRIVEVTEHFDVGAAVCVNKSDLSDAKTKEIEAYCEKKGLPLVGRLSYDNVTTKAMIEKKSVIEFSDGRFSKEVREVWGNVMKVLA